MATHSIVGLDIGTTKIGAIIAETDEQNQLKIVGIGTSPSAGLKKGVVINLEKTVYSIQKAINDAEMMAGLKVNTVYAGIAGDHIRSLNSRGVVAVSRSGNEIGYFDIERVLDAARTIAIPHDREILHILPLEYTIDDQSGIKDPLGMSGVRLEAEVHIITASLTCTQNLYRSIKKAGLEPNDLVLEPLASSFAVLSPEEQELGVVLIDMGGGTTDIGIFYDGTIRHTAVIPYGGQNVTNDIAIGLRTPIDQAETIKKSYGSALACLVDSDEMITVPGVGGREPKSVSRSVLANIIEPRIEEIFSLAAKEIKKCAPIDMLAAGVVLTGGGSLMEGIEDLAEQTFDMPVKVGKVTQINGMNDIACNPMFATGVGLVLFGYKELQKNHNKKNGYKNKFFARIKHLLNEYF